MEYWSLQAAGNERLQEWAHIVAPSDADSILAVGAVDSTLQIATFSSPRPHRRW